MVLLILYLIKSTCCLTLFYLGYKTLLSNETFFRFNRIVLLVGMLVCLLLPLLKLKTESIGIIRQPIAQLEKILMEDEANQSSIESREKQILITQPQKVGISITQLLFFLLIAGSLINMFLIIRSCFYLRKIIRTGKKIDKNSYKIIVHEREIIPFSYGKYIVISENDYKNSPEIIIMHELVHYRKNHLLDLLFAEFIILLHWFNPAAWLLKRELQEVHEFQADMEVLNKGINATTYQLLLVKKTVGSSSYTFANSFNHSKLKKRITMMLKKKSNSWARLKLMLLVPVAIITIQAFARPEVNRQPKDKSPLLMTYSDLGENINWVYIEIIDSETNNTIYKSRIKENTSLNEIRNKFKDINIHNQAILKLSPTAKTPMGLITDIKQVFHEAQNGTL